MHWRRAITWLLLGLVVVLPVAGCRSDTALEEGRAQAVADTCRSIAERRIGVELDREALHRDAGAEALLALYVTKDGRYRTSASLIRNLCRPRPS